MTSEYGACGGAGSDVVSTSAGGTLDVSALTITTGSSDTLFNLLFVAGGLGAIRIGLHGANFDIYQGIAGPSNFGGSGFTTSTVGTGAVLGVAASNGWIYVPDNYVSGAAVGASSGTWSGTTLALLGLTVGSYTWTWGSEGNADSITVNVVPEPSTALLLGFGLAILASSKHRRRRIAT